MKKTTMAVKYLQNREEAEVDDKKSVSLVIGKVPFSTSAVTSDNISWVLLLIISQYTIMKEEEISDKTATIKYYKDIPAYGHFLQHHLLPNIPALFGPALTESWKARREWVEQSSNNNNNNNSCHDEQQDHSEIPAMQPRFDYLKNEFGSAQVGVADCIERDFTDQKRSEMSFDEFVKVWPAGRYYLKDWHFVRSFPEYNAYKVPHVFEDDWMNEYWLKDNKDDYRFVYMGGDGTFTPLHADVYRSYSWSSNICGIKKWTLFPPGEERLLKDKLGNLAYDLRSIDPVQFPCTKQAKRIVVYQRDGETLFVPSGWFHQVENIGLTISINHNWSNACNLGMTFRSLASDLDDVERSIDDVRESMAPLEFVQTCQHLLLLHSGWDWCIFLKMLHCIARRLSLSSHQQQLQKEEKTISPPHELLRLQHHQPDLAWQAQQILDVIEAWNKKTPEKLLMDEYLEQQGLRTYVQEIKELLQDILDINKCLSPNKLNI
ncbi:hypothetical protein BDB00DRAFT_826953 [Zychaea mexicana]|uniref:uncharacterized protein n=1 Tax=Zychaea mexicana TaxID=64656 RepID=UPI0022FE7F0D|nr:uncharacterized protein BDB00DRAFT_826953 [Zychaea mexicana]KAI9492732.1 hypothetical protein BDB00DRAFT_826953 [Zychaea mexicana]